MKLYEQINEANWLNREATLEERARGKGCLLNQCADLYQEETPAIVDRLLEALSALYPATHYVSPWQFNDAKGTTVDDIIRVCKVADV